jgi:hypothetical protein
MSERKRVHYHRLARRLIAATTGLLSALLLFTGLSPRQQGLLDRSGLPQAHAAMRTLDPSRGLVHFPPTLVR